MDYDDDILRHSGKYYGKYSATVKENTDDEMLGRIRVVVPAVFGEEVDVQARPCFPATHFYVPPVDASVWVEFEAGDPGYPIWTGVWYPQGQAPTETQIDPPDNRVIQTPSGHTIELLDTDGEEKILIKHKGKSFLSIDKDGTVLLANQNGSHLVLDAKDGRAGMMEEHGNLINLDSDGITLVDSDGLTLEMKGANLRVLSSGKVQISAQEVALDASNVAIGTGANQSAVLGEILATALATHVHPTAVGPSGPSPTLAALPATALSKSVKVKL